MSIVLDIVSILTILHLSLEKLVTQRFGKILIPQLLLDELKDYKRDLFRLRPSAVVGSSEGQRYFLEISPEHNDQKEKLLDKILEFITTNVQVMPAMGIIDVERRFIEVVGEPSTASILLAKEHNIPLYSDDLRIREVAEQHWQVKGFDSQSMLHDLYQQSMIESHDYYNALSKLARSNYHFIRVDVDLLVFMLEQNRMEITVEIQNLFKLLQGPDCEIESAVRVTSELIKRIWLRQMLQHQKSFILDLALRTLFTGRNSGEVLPMLYAQLRRNFWLVEFKLPEILARVEFWGRQTLP